jgi:hypothetical protein
MTAASVPAPSKSGQILFIGGGIGKIQNSAAARLHH